MNSLQAILQDFRAQVDQFIACDVVNISSGMTLGSETADPNFDASLASAVYAEVAKANRRALDLLGLGADSCEDILITTDNALLLMRMLGPDHYMGVALGPKATLGMARAIMRKYEPQLLQVVTELHV